MVQTGQSTGRTLTLRHDAAKRLFDYWNALRTDRTAPPRRDVDPAALRPFLANTFILELCDANHALFRIAGTSLCAAFGRELRDHNFLSLGDDAARLELQQVIETVRRTACGGLIRFVATTLDKSPHPGEFVVLPLTDDSGRISRAIGHFQLYRGIESLALRKLIRLQVSSAVIIDPASDRIEVDAGGEIPLRTRPLSLVKSLPPPAPRPSAPSHEWARKLASFIDTAEE